MNKFFSLDSPLMKGLTTLADIMILSIIYLVTCLPIVTIGASTTALFYVMLKLVRNEENYVLKGYFKSFRQNFKNATILWLLLLLLGIIFTVDVYYFIHQPGILNYVLRIVFIIISVIYVCVLMYIFPLLATFENTNKKLLTFSFILSIRHFISTIVMICGLLACIYFTLRIPYFFFFFITVLALL